MSRLFSAGFAAWVLVVGAAGGLGCSSGDDGSGGSGGSAANGGSAGTGGTGGTAPTTKNIYINQVPGTDCLPRPLTADSSGHVPCGMIEARPKSSSACTCDAALGRVPVTDKNLVQNVEQYLMNIAQCGAQGTPACSDYCYCELQQFEGAELLTCEGAPTDPGTQYGYCYVDPKVDSNGDGTPDANPDLLADCNDTEKRKLRFLGADVPASDALLLIACEGATAAN